MTAVTDESDSFIPNTKHMGEPESFKIILQWLYDLMGIDANPDSQLATLPFRPSRQLAK